MQQNKLTHNSVNIGPIQRCNRRGDTFVFAVCGDSHVRNVNKSLEFFKRFSSAEILVIKGRSTEKVNHDQVIDAVVPTRYNDHQASIILKTSLHRIVAGASHRYCYIDSDVVTVNERVDEIFNLWQPPIIFAADHSQIDLHSPSVVNCGCSTASRCSHLRMAIRSKFDVDIPDGNWQHWNGGVFLFGQESKEFLDSWNSRVLALFNDKFWRTRDQGALAATVWEYGLQNHAMLPEEFNLIVDPFRHRIDGERAALKPTQYTVDERYSLEATSSKSRPRLIHFINAGIGKAGWKNWDDAVAYRDNQPQAVIKAQSLSACSSTEKKDVCTVNRLTTDNRIVHGMWIGETLSKLELLTICSFLDHGHEFHLWAYDDIKTPLPARVCLKDATQILPRDTIYRRKEVDPETGVGKNSLGPFSDLFRCKLLYEMGGYWADMDVTCLRPLDFETDYVFRSHRVGTVGNLMKCPAHSQVMLDTFTAVRDGINENSEWLAPVRMLASNVERLILSQYIRQDICNEDRWVDSIQNYVERDAALPPQWYFIHWINEFWRTLETQNGYYRGRKILDNLPDKNRPFAGSTLSQLYRKYDLLDACKVSLPSFNITSTVMHDGIISTHEKPVVTNDPPLNKPAADQPRSIHYDISRHINVLLPSLSRGGAERSVLDVLSGLAEVSSTGNLFVMYCVDHEYPVSPPGRYKIHWLCGMDERSRLKLVAREVQSSPCPILYTHMLRAEQLRHLWNIGILTAPVIQNSEPSWQDPADAFNHPSVPFVVAVSDAVASQLRLRGCRKPVLTIRHEMQHWHTPEALTEQRIRLRKQIGIREDTLLVGMVGQFKSQKAYPRAVRVLHTLQKLCRAKLMILGGWDHEFGNGRLTYTATCRQALDLGVMPDIIMPGDVYPVDPYYAAFDVFLNTSIYEGLSVAMLEAIQHGCPIVTADAGGNREVLPPNAVLIEESADIDAYVRGISIIVRRSERAVPQRPTDADLVPRLWCMIVNHGLPSLCPKSSLRRGTLFLTDNLNLGGPQRSLTNLLCHLPWDYNAHLCVLNTVYAADYYNEVKRHVNVTSLSAVIGVIDRVEQILELSKQANVKNICFWNVDVRVKLLLSKALEVSDIRLIDVSPGPMLFDEMRGSVDFQRRSSFSSVQYFHRLNVFVSKYDGGEPSKPLADTFNLVTIPNGVPMKTGTVTNPPVGFSLPDGANPNLVIGTVCRITPSKRIEYLVEMMEELSRRVPGVTLIVVGGVDPRNLAYWHMVQELVDRSGLTNICFAGGHEDVAPFLNIFRVFVMVSDDQGCPNASLEAMSMGLPVVANSSGGTKEQVEDGVNGFLVSDEEPADMARRVEFLLKRPRISELYGQASRARARSRFSMESMVERYMRVLNAGTDTDMTV